MKRRISWFLVVGALTVALVGCSDDTKGTPSASPSTTTAAAAATSASPTSGATSTSKSGTSTSSTAATTTDSHPSLFPADFPYPTNLTIEKRTNDKASALIEGTTATSADEIIAFYDTKLPPLGWTYSEGTSSGGAHQFTRGPLTASIVASKIPDSDQTTFQFSIITSE
ncbi:hypothetical protein [Antrihabitans stalactiti]|uniref:Lipoprotein n=1 Tax=Antrihabitans stalactiti TaxID=2584121 RepID=A0A848KT04_9NOCA|nr:hypothetical protein [Antrihabitans stalactiti]NMN98687.1 hypothetical protein [Antrihabitans stalactiti]